MPGAPGDLFLEVGIVVRVHGIKGKIKVKTHSGQTDGLSCVRRVYFTPEGIAGRIPSPTFESGYIAFDITDFQTMKNGALLTLDGVRDVDTAKLFVNKKIFVRVSDLPEPDEDEYYCFELEGFTAVDTMGRVRGRVVRVIASPAHDILVISTPGGERLVPFVEEFVPEVRREERVVVISPIRGLLDDEI
ncbi:MAG: 16S rRNA processing protein RimM [Deltaproteobacteria bacterium]|nr:MAG: 16S rRNA processing protein RimM [Deltaproteobacteria bacterium]